MRRTYRSKKDTTGTLDHRDVFQNLDDRSSAFDAFYIQNIKQTKRELSCMGSTNQFGISSNKVRKRKYVKRVVKDVEIIKPRETMSPVAFLTPDKSFRVNKVLDPFDMLLISSPASQLPETTAPEVKNDVFETLQPKKESKTYTRKKVVKAKKINYSSSDSYDSEKENSSGQCNVTDIRAHKLIVEKEPIISPKIIDESINKILNNISLLKNIKRKTTNTSFKTSNISVNNSNYLKTPNKSFNIQRRLSRNYHSPILQKSPLCSTPFKEKYRGQSIYNFSPICVKNDSPNYVTIEEENDSNNSIILVPKLSKTSNKSSQKINEISKVHDRKTNDSKEASIQSNNLEIENISLEREIENIETSTANNNYADTIVNVQENDIMNKENDDNNMSIMNVSAYEEGGDKNEREELNNIDSTEMKNLSLQITVAEPFLGFTQIAESSSQNKSTDKTNSKSTELTSFQNTETETFLGFSHVNQSLIDYKNYLAEHLEKTINSIEDSDNSCVENVKIAYDTHNNESANDISYIENNQIDHYRESEETCNSMDNIEDSVGDEKSESTNDNSSTQDYDNESMYDTCSDMSDDNVRKEPVVAIERLNHDLFMQYYNKMKNKNKSNESISSNMSYNSLNTDSNDVQAIPNEIIITDSDDVTSSNEDDNSIEESFENDNNSNEGEGCISFVTTRRRHEIANDSMFCFDNSYESNSTECDKTVVSNKLNLERESLSLNEDKDMVDNLDDKANLAEINNELEKVTTRKSYRLTRQSNVDLYSSSVDMTLTEDDEKSARQIDEDKNSNKSNKEIYRQSSVTVRKTSVAFRNSQIMDSSRYKINSVDNRKKSMTFRNNQSIPMHTSRCEINSGESSRIDTKPGIVLQPGKKWERSLSIYRRMTIMADHFDQSLLDDENLQAKGRKYRQSVISTMEMQDSLHNDTIISRRNTLSSKPSRPTIRFVKDSIDSRVSLNSTSATVYDDLKGFLNEECDDTIIELSKLSLDSEHEVTVLDNFHDSERVTTAKDYVLRRCNQTDPVLFDECYPETILKNCHKIGEGVYGEVFLYRARDGRARVMKIVPIAGHVKVNGETQKDFHEIISEIVIAMELSALRAPIEEINRQFDEGKDVDAIDLPGVENATDVFNEVLAVRCVFGPYPSRLLDLWDLYDECKGSENDNPATLPIDQQYIVLELANAGQDLESYQFASAQQAHALFQQIAFGLAVGEEAYQFEHRDLHWGNVLIAPTEQKYASFVLRNRVFRVARCGVAATIIDYSLSRVSLALGPAGDHAQLYNDLAADEQLFDAVGDYQFQVYRLMRDKLGNDWKNFEPYTNILWLHYTVDKMITALRYKRTNTKIHKHYIEKLKGIRDRILDYSSATLYVLTDNEI